MTSSDTSLAQLQTLGLAYPVDVLLECMMGSVLLIQNNRISMTQGNNRISKVEVLREASYQMKESLQ